MFVLEKKVAIVVGAANGIGRATALAFAAAGAAVTCEDVEEAGARTTAAEIGHFDLEPAPGGDLDDAAQAAFARSYESYRAASAEQVTTNPSP